MLFDRKELIENELLQYKKYAAKCYLEIATSSPSVKLEKRIAYDSLLEQISVLETDLIHVNEMLEQNSHQTSNNAATLPDPYCSSSNDLVLK
jgi:hypothetical protein